MPWTCPNCYFNLGQQMPSQSLPRPDEHYRCPICRLDLTFNPTAKKLEPAPPQAPRDPERNDAA